MFDSSTWIWLGVLIAGLGMLGLFTTLASRKREHAWKKAARRLKIRYFSRDGRSEISGTVKGIQLRLTESPSTSDTEAGMILAMLYVTVHGLPEKMEAEWSPGIWSEIAHLTEEHVLLGVPEFDQHVVLKADQLQSVQAYWTKARQAVFLQLAVPQNGERIVLGGKSLSAERRGLNNDPDEIESWVRSFVDAAQQLS